MTEIGDRTVFSQVDANNNSATNPGWPEGTMPVSRLNDSARALQGAMVRDWDYSHPVVTTTGTASAYVATYTQPPSAYFKGMEFCVLPHITNTGSAAINFGPGSLVIKKVNDSGALVGLTGGEIQAGNPTDFVYSDTLGFMILKASYGSAPIIQARIVANFDGTASTTVTTTYVLSGAGATTLTVTQNGHGHLINHVVRVNFTSGLAGGQTPLITVTAVTTNTWTGIYTGAGSGTATSGSSQSIYKPLNGVAGDNKNVHSVCANNTSDGDFIINYLITAPTIYGQQFYGSVNDSVINANVVTANPVAAASTTSWRIQYAYSSTGAISSSEMRAVISW